MKRLFTFLILSCLVLACTPKQEAIAYGENDCSFCKMTIVDKIHGAEFVTTKGKVYKYDAVECMVRTLIDWEGPEIELYLVNHFETPAELIDARKATFLISKELPSPMGGFLTAFKTDGAAQNALAEYGGVLYNWEELLAEYK